MNAVERYELILQALQKEEVVLVNEIAELTGASLPTVRRDLTTLEEKNLVVRFHGGVMLAEKKEEGLRYVLKDRLPIEQNAKMLIAQKASEFVEDGDIIFLDSGSTTFYMCDFLKGKNITVVTNGIYHVTRLAENGIPTYVLGGQIRTDSKSILSQDVVEKLSQLAIDKAFLGVRGIDKKNGYTTTDSFDSLMKRTAISVAGKSYVLADPSKMNQRKLYSYGKLQDAILITTKNDVLQADDVEIILAE